MRLLLMLFVLFVGLAVSGCSSSRHLLQSEYAQQVTREATAEAVSQVGELIEARFGIPMPDSFREQLTEVLVTEITKGMDDLLQDAEAREKAKKEDED